MTERTNEFANRLARLLGWLLLSVPVHFLADKMLMEEFGRILPSWPSGVTLFWFALERAFTRSFWMMTRWEVILFWLSVVLLFDVVDVFVLKAEQWGKPQ